VQITVDASDPQIGVLPVPGRRHPRRPTPGTLRLHVGLQDAFPPVWRRIEVASDLGLVDLHDVLQVAFGWQDYHLHRFTTGPWGDPGMAFVCTADLVQAQEWDDDNSPPTWDVRVDELLAVPGERLFYNYDYGDNWWLVIEVEDVVDGAVPPGRVTLVEGAGAGPPEDCGGVDGYRLMVAAADPTHPDHRRALAEAADRYGYEVEPDQLGVVPFNGDALAARLGELGLADRPPPPCRVGEQLAGLLLRARDTDTERKLITLASWADGAADIDADTAAVMMRPLQVLLDVVGDGIRLTAAGYLPPAIVVALFDQLDMADEWIGKGNREDLTLPVLELREAGQRLGLLRKAKGRLLPTARGRKLAADPVGLWCHLANRLPLGGSDITDAGWQAGVLLLAVMASGDTTGAADRIADLLTGLGWAIDGGRPIDPRTARGLVAGDADLLGRIGSLDRDWRAPWPGPVTTGGVALARAALAGRET